MDNLVSVIVPIHNTGKYLKKCLNSIVNQTYKNLEILLINDGSTDNSAKIIDQFAKKDTRIKVFTNETAQGVSNARNLGLDNASGEYINFVDGDDWILKDAINSLVKTLENNDSDLSQGNIKCVISPLKISNNNVIKNWIVGNNKNLVQCFIHIESGSCDNKIFKKAIINSYNLRFKSINIFEDSNFLLS